MSKNLPLGWADENLGNLVLKLVDGSHNPPSGKSSGQKMLSARNILDGRIDATECRLLDEESFVQEDKRTQVEAGDVLLTIVGTIGRSAVVPEDFEQITLQRSVAVIKPIEVSSSFVSYQLRGSGCQQYFDQAARGTAQKGVYLGALAQLPLRIPPIAEQHRIVDKIDELFSSIDEGERVLERVRKLVERYRQSVLKAAVTGELTRDWREQHAGELESGEALLTRILDARRKAWETAELAKMTAKNQRPLNDTWKKKYVAPPPPDIADLPELPPSWTWASLGSLIVVGPQNGVYIPQAKYGSGTPIIRIDDFQTDWIRPVGELRRVQATDQDCLAYGVKRADLIINRVNSVSHLGKCMLVPEGFDGALFESNMMRCSVSDLVVKEVLVAYLNSEFGRRRATKNCKHAVNQASINQDDVAEIPIPLPPLAEQQALVDAIHLEMSKLPADIDDVSKLAAALRQSLLRDAFAGLIVPQDPTDEPASTLLERIAAQRSDRDSPRKRVPKPLRRKNVKA